MPVTREPFEVEITIRPSDAPQHVGGQEQVLVVHDEVEHGALREPCDGVPRAYPPGRVDAVGQEAQVADLEEG